MRARLAAAMPAAVLAAALLAPMAAPGAALGYGTGVTWATGAAGTPPGAWAGVGGAGSDDDGGAAATLTETDAAAAPDVLHPSERTFDSGSAGWSSSDQGQALCSTSSGHDPGRGQPPGSLRSSYSTALNLLGLLASCSSTWTSAPFTWEGGQPSAVAFSVDRAVEAGALVGAGTIAWQARLVDETGGGSTTLVSESRSSSAAWGARTAAGLGPGDIADGHTYRIELRASFSTNLVSAVSGVRVNFDNVRLSVTPRNMRADGELVVDGVPPGSTHTLEMRARTTAEPFVVEVASGGSWTSLGTVSSTTYADVSHGLTPAEWNDGDVRVRLRDTETGVDDTADVLSVEHLRVVSTGGIAVSGPASVTMPEVTLDGLAPAVSAGQLGDVEVVDAGGSASGWDLTATAGRWELDGHPGELLPADALTIAPSSPTSPAGSVLAGVEAGDGGVLGPGSPVTLMSAGPGHGVGTYRQSPSLSLTIPVTAIHGVYRTEITVTAS